MEGFAGIIGAAERLDQNITLAINSLHSPPTDALWVLFSDKRVWYLMYFALAVLLFVRLGWKKALITLFGVALTVAACDQGANLVKDGVARLRPVWDNYMVSHGLHRLEGRGNFYGFFSAHAANSLGVATLVVKVFRSGDKSRNYRSLAAVMYFWAASVGISRVFVGKHFLGDVLAGFAAGLLIGLVFAGIIRRIFHKYSLYL